MHVKQDHATHFVVISIIASISILEALLTSTSRTEYQMDYLCETRLGLAIPLVEETQKLSVLPARLSTLCWFWAKLQMQNLWKGLARYRSFHPVNTNNPKGLPSPPVVILKGNQHEHKLFLCQQAGDENVFGYIFSIAPSIVYQNKPPQAVGDVLWAHFFHFLFKATRPNHDALFSLSIVWSDCAQWLIQCHLALLTVLSSVQVTRPSEVEPKKHITSGTITLVNGKWITDIKVLYPMFENAQWM